MTSKQKQAGVPFILGLVFLDMLSMGIIFPVLPELVGHYTDNPELQSYWFGALAASYGLMQFLFAPVLGALSDRFGRRPILLLSIAGMALDSLLIASASSLWVLLVARIIGGITGAGYSVATAYASDVTPPAQRAQAFGMIGAAFGMGFIIGPVAGGFLGEIGIQVPFYAAAGLCAVNALYGLFVLPESLPEAHRSPFSLARSNPFGALKLLSRLDGLGSLVAVWAVFQLAMVMVVETWVLYAHFRYGWSSRMNGLSLFAVGIATAIVQGGLVGVLSKKLGDEKTILVGLASGIVGYAGYGLATEGWMLFPVIFGTLTVFATGPAILAIASKSTKPTEQGVMMGAMNSVRMLMTIIGPAIGVPLLGQVAHLPGDHPGVGIVFFLCAALQAVAWIFAKRHFARQSAAVSAPAFGSGAAVDPAQ
jgi:MFS transporter, DHA1 family, tetracycline resistance protein